MSMGIERWGFLFSVVSSPIVNFLKTTRAVCPNIKRSKSSMAAAP